MKTSSSSASDVNVTSSTIPIVKLFLGSFCAIFLNTATICSGVVSFDDNPYLPPTISGAFSFP